MRRNSRQTEAQWQEYQRLELLSDRQDKLGCQEQSIAPDSISQTEQPLSKTTTNLVKRLRSSLATISDRLTKEPEVKVWQKRDRRGHIYWRAYDPVTGQSTCLASEAEMRSWLEQLRLSAMHEKATLVNLGWQ